MFVAGPKVTGGLVGKYPKLDDLTDGDLRFGVDFRSVYATLLDQWLGVESRLILGDKFPALSLVDVNKKVEPPSAPPGGPKPASAGPTPSPPAKE
jgi:uncharacterized protein (DUF1501 family)